MATVSHTTAPSTPSPFWHDFHAGVLRAAGELEKLADDPLLLSRIVANPDAYGLDRPGLLAGYVARVAEGLRRKRRPARKAAGGPSGAAKPR